MTTQQGTVASVGVSSGHTFTKQPCSAIRLIAGLGVEGDAHSGALVKHRSRVAKDPSQPNLRQAHIIHAELFDELAAQGFHVRSGDLGENITSRGVDLLALPRGALLHFGEEAVIEITGLRNPCQQINAFQPGLMQAVIERADDGGLVRKSGVMGVVRSRSSTKWSGHEPAHRDRRARVRLRREGPRALPDAPAQRWPEHARGLALSA